MTLPSHSDVELLDLAQLEALGLVVNAVALWNTCYLDAVTRSAHPACRSSRRMSKGSHRYGGFLIGTPALFPPVPAVTQRPSSAARTRSAYARQTPVP